MDNKIADALMLRAQSDGSFSESSANTSQYDSKSIPYNFNIPELEGQEE